MFPGGIKRCTLTGPKLPVTCRLVLIDETQGAELLLLQSVSARGRTVGGRWYTGDDIFGGLNASSLCIEVIDVVLYKINTDTLMISLK